MVLRTRLESADRQLLSHLLFVPVVRDTAKHRGVIANSRRLRWFRGNGQVALLSFFPRPEWQAQRAIAKAAASGPARSRGSLSLHFFRRIRAALRPFRDSVWPAPPSSTQRDRAVRVQGRVRPACPPRFRRHFRCPARCAPQKIRRAAWFAPGTEDFRSARQRTVGRGEWDFHISGIFDEHVWRNRRASRRAVVSI